MSAKKKSGKKHARHKGPGRAVKALIFAACLLLTTIVLLYGYLLLTR